MNNVTYVKERKLNVFAKGITFTGIPVLQSTSVSFYQKYILLILQNGILASSKETLAESLSNMLNVSLVCVKEFIVYLDQNSYLVFDEYNEKYTLSPSVHFLIKPEFNNAMFAELDIKKADCDKIIYLGDVDRFYHESDFDEEIFRKKGIGSTSSTITQTQLNNALVRDESAIRSLIEKSFANTNVHIQPNFTYDVELDSVKDMQIEFSALMQYEYSSESKMSKRITTTVPEKNMLPADVLNTLSAQFDVDDSIPRFIEYDESFYQRILPTTEAYTNVEDAIEAAGEMLVPLKDSAQELKARLSQVKNEYKKDLATEQAKVSFTKGELEKVKKDIEMNESIMSGADVQLIENLKATIEELSKKKDDLATRVRDNQVVIESMQQQFKEREAAFIREIENKETEIHNIGETVIKYQFEQLKMKKDFDELLNSGPKKFNRTVASVIDKYPPETNIFYRKVSSICIELDKALSASDCEAYDEVAESLDIIRESYRKVLQVVFETILSQNMQTLGIFLGDTFNVINLEKECKKRNVSAGLISRIITFHNLSNAIGHSAENNQKTKDNVTRIDSFKRLSQNERQNVLLSIPEFFNTVKFKNNEVKTIANKLKI